MFSIAKKLIIGLALTGLLFTQTGCLYGQMAGSRVAVYIGAALWAGGLVTGITYATGAGILLSDENPGRADALNVIPMDEEIAAEHQTDFDTIALYNDELDQVLAANQKLEELIQTYAREDVSAAELDIAASELGLGSGQELVEVLESQTLSRDALFKFAQSQELSPEVAALYLQMRFAVVSE
jgi:hypothetical protein